MSNSLFSLQTIDHLVDRYPLHDPEGHRLLKVLRHLTPTTQDLKSPQGFSTQKIIKEFYKEQLSQPVASMAVKIEATREVLNKNLLEMFDKNSNPAGILVGDGFSFIQLKRHKFKPSELAFRLPETLHEEIQTKVQLLNEQSQEEEKRLEALKEKEDSLIAQQSEIETNAFTFRKSHKEQLEDLKNSFDLQQSKYEEEIYRLKKELAQLQNQQMASQSNQENKLKEDIDERTQLDQVLEAQFSTLETNQKEFAFLIKKLKKQEIEFIQLKKRERKRVRQRELYLKKTAEAHLERIQAWDQRLIEINQSESVRRKQQEQDFRKNLQELQQDFKRQLLHFQLQANEGAERSIKLEEERQQIMIKKQALSGEIQSRTEEFLKKRQKELEQKEGALKKGLDHITRLSTLLNKEKTKWLDSAISDEGTLYTRAEFESLVQEQEKLLRSLNSMVKNFEVKKRQEEELLEYRQLGLDKERKELFAQVQKERETLQGSIKQLNLREEGVIERETQELARLHEDYEDLRLSLEVNQIEKEERLSEREASLRQRELDLQELFKEYQEANRHARNEWVKQEEMIQTELENLLSSKLEQDTLQTEAREFLAEMKTTFEHRMTLQKDDFENFQKQMESIKTDATRIKNHLEEEAESAQSTQASMGQTLKQRIRQHQKLIETLEENLKTQVEHYHDQNLQLRESREDLHKSERTNLKTFLENMNRHHMRLQEIGQALEELSDTYLREQALGGIQLESAQAAEPTISNDEGFSEDRALDEWDHLLHRLSRMRGDRTPEVQPRFLDEWCIRWNQWVSIEPGEFLMGAGNKRDALPEKRTRIEHQLQVSRYPITNVEFMRFVLNTGYQTEAETGHGGIVYFSGLPDNGNPNRVSSSTPTLETMNNASWWSPDGQTDSIKDKYNHPVTLVTWNDAHAFCQWKSEQLGFIVRLPTETEWEYLASNFGENEKDVPWGFEEGLQHCNLAESRIGSTTAVDNFPEHTRTGGALDLFGNVYEWVLDGPPPAGRSPDLDYKLARGGGHLTQFQQVARWRRLAFLSTYRTSFIGFRVVVETASALNA
ncbi:MAG: SUMF1/EgtB/PvdO family nonheme iron enzyme [Candidatus Nitronauta litoralis]|uniref:SUMF1/EgtB/PvdO family nonheme iron enzyme n=1 Tax=Candidatus Nitronauta litoralis TaxID=2705533 RepID=A0A7T0BYC5_9BACT|nr:MAG: SUMF1/EgtB/PvdO family nonheme iron enzyme [Candidatus Nitronauta litoralis]